MYLLGCILKKQLVEKATIVAVFAFIIVFQASRIMFCTLIFHDGIYENVFVRLIRGVHCPSLCMNDDRVSWCIIIKPPRETLVSLTEYSFVVQFRFRWVLKNSNSPKSFIHDALNLNSMWIERRWYCSCHSLLQFLVSVPDRFEFKGFLQRPFRSCYATWKPLFLVPWSLFPSLRRRTCRHILLQSALLHRNFIVASLDSSAA